MMAKTLEVHWADPKELEVHPLNAALTPEMNPEEIETLKESMRLKGFLEAEAVRVLKGTNLVIDGKNRLRAARDLGIKVAAIEIEVEEDELPYFILSSTYHRRHIPTGIRAANAALCYPLLEQAAAEKRRMGLKFYKQNLCRDFKNETLCLTRHKVEVEDFSFLKELLVALYEKTGGKRIDFLAKFFRVAKRDIGIALWLKRFLPEDFEALRKGEITMAEAREIYRRARPEIEARYTVIPEWKELSLKIPEMAEFTAVLACLDEETQRELYLAIKEETASADEEESPSSHEAEISKMETAVKEIVEHPEVKALTGRLRNLEEEKKTLKEQLHDLEKQRRRLEMLIRDERRKKEELEARIEELESGLDVAVVPDPEKEAELERLRAQLKELENKLEAARSEAEAGLKAREETEKRIKELEESLRGARKYVTNLIKVIDPPKRRARKKFLDRLTRSYERRIEKLKEKNKKLKEMLNETRTEAATLKTMLINRELKAVSMRILQMLLAVDGLLRSPEFVETVTGILKDPNVDAAELLDLVGDLQDAARQFGERVVEAVREKRKELETSLEAEDFVKGLKLPGKTKKPKDGLVVIPKKITLRVRRPEK